jgi:phosphatidylglycerophosphate synthase
VADDLDRASGARGHEHSIVEQSSEPREPGSAARLVPNLLSAFRFAAAAAWIASSRAGYGGFAWYASLVGAAAATDFIDGRLARWLGAVSVTGRWLDAIADVTFVLAALFSEAAKGALPFYIPMLIALSFGQYALDSIVLRHSEGGPVRSRLGHWGGIINYALVFGFAFGPLSPSVPAAIRDFAPVFGLFYAAAIIERALSYRWRAIQGPPTGR